MAWKIKDNILLMHKFVLYYYRINVFSTLLYHENSFSYHKWQDLLLNVNYVKFGLIKNVLK